MRHSKMMESFHSFLEYKYLYQVLIRQQTKRQKYRSLFVLVVDQDSRILLPVKVCTQSQSIEEVYRSLSILLSFRSASGKVRTETISPGSVVSIKVTFARTLMT